MTHSPRHQPGFTLLEIIITLVIISGALWVLVQAQASAVFMNVESEEILIGASLAEEKMAEVQLLLEQEGFGGDDIEESGDFADISEMYDGAEFDERFTHYQWAYTIREIDLQLGDLGGAMESLTSAGFGGNTLQNSENTQNMQQPDLSMLGMQPDMIGDMLSPYIREVRVLVWWGSDEDLEREEGCEKCVELVTHAINPSGVVNLAGGNTGGEE